MLGNSHNTVTTRLGGWVGGGEVILVLFRSVRFFFVIFFIDTCCCRCSRGGKKESFFFDCSDKQPVTFVYCVRRKGGEWENNVMLGGYCTILYAINVLIAYVEIPFSYQFFSSPPQKKKNPKNLSCKALLRLAFFPPLFCVCVYKIHLIFTPRIGA